MDNSPETPLPISRSLRLMLIEDDPVFRLGLIAGFSQHPQIQVVAEASSGLMALQILQNTAPGSLDLILLSLDLGLVDGNPTGGLLLGQQLKSQYPTLPVLLLGSSRNPAQITRAFRLGAAGYCARGTTVTELVRAMYQVVAGQSYWDQAMQVMAGSSRTEVEPIASPARRWFVSVKQELRQSGVGQIETAIARLQAQLSDPNLSALDQLVLAGQLRELRAARWLVQKLLATADPVDSQPEQVPLPPAMTRSAPVPPVSSPGAEAPVAPIAPLPETAVSSRRSLRAALFDTISGRLQFSLYNLTNTPLEIDILKPEKQRELLYIVLRKLEEALDDLQFSQVSPDQLAVKQPAILRDIWQATTIDFFGKYYTLELGNQPIEIVPILLQDEVVVQTAILDRIPLVADCLAHLLFQTPLTIEGVAYSIGSVEAMVRMEILLQNLILRIANAVVQPLLNRFGDVVDIKQLFYDKRLLSSREIERFRNSLSWKYRIEQNFREPVAIFESRFDLLILRESGITRTSIYAPRNQELRDLEGIPYAVTLALEARDAISPPLRSAIAFLGSGVVYVLTEVIGRGIGLIGRGIVKGVGNVFQDSRFDRSGERWR